VLEDSINCSEIYEKTAYNNWQEIMWSRRALTCRCAVPYRYGLTCRCALTWKCEFTCRCESTCIFVPI